VGRRVEALAVGLLVVGIADLLLWPQPSRVTRENFDRIREGMSRAEVEAILGPPVVYANGPVFLPALKQCVLGGEPRGPTYLAWYTDDATVSIDFDESGGVVMTRFGNLYPHSASNPIAGGIYPETPYSATEQETMKRRLVDVLRDIVGNPFALAPVVDPAWLRWSGGTVRMLAEVAYEERQLPEGTLHPPRLPLLADALEDAGCADADLLGHLRGPGPHVRGCWALDLILGKG
jgi:hypothetical protein